MSTHKNINKICIFITILALIFTIVFMNGEKLGLKSIVDEDAENYEDSVYFTTNDQNGNWDDTDATTITLNGDTCKISGNGAYVNGNQVVISGGGKYVISGTWDDGSIVVDAYSSSKVFIKLTGVNIYCSDDACFRVNQADKVFLTLAEGTANIFESGEEYSDEALEDGTGGTIFAHDDLTINGSGSLTVTANYKHGIDANDDLIITGGTIAINAVKDGVHVNDSVRIKEADITIDAQDDGLVTAKEESYVYIESGALTVTSSDDGIHSAGDVLIAGGEVNITAGDDGIHSDTNVTVAGGYILIPQCYEGIEAVTIDVTGGEVEVYPTDDGFNANGGSGDMFGMQGGMNDQNGNMGGPGGNFNPWNTTDTTQSTDSTTENTEENSDNEEDEETYINISGGKITIINETGQDADGLDSNGSIYISGGEIYVSLSGNGTNNAIDYASENNGICEINGGIVIACGGSGMVEEMSSTSTQASIMYNLSTTAEANTTVKLTSSDGEELFSYEVPCSYSSVVISTPEVKQGETYTLTMGDTKEEITLESIAGTYGTAVSTMGGMGGMIGGGMQGGMQGRGMRGGRMFNQDESSTDSSITDSSQDEQGSTSGQNATGTQDSVQKPNESDTVTDAQNHNESDTVTNVQDQNNDGDQNAADGQNGDTQNTEMQNLTDGTPPDMNGDFTPPDMSGNGDFTPPDMSGNENQNSNQNFSQGKDMNNQNASTEEEVDDDTTTYSGQKEVTNDEWIWIGAATGVLVLGLLVATLYKRW